LADAPPEGQDRHRPQSVRTAALHVEYLRPTPIDAQLHLEATVSAVDGNTSTVACTLDAAGKARARATVTAVRVPESWRHGSPS
jgi:acyl-CoA thioesterase FadM